MLVGATESSDCAELSKCLGIPPGRVGRDGGRLPDNVDSTAAGKRHLGVPVCELWILVEDTARHDEVSADILSVVFAQCAKSSPRIPVEVSGRDIFGNVGNVHAGRVVPLARNPWPI